VELDAFAGAAPFGAALLDGRDAAEATIVHANPALEAMVGGKPLAGIALQALIEPASWTEAMQAMESGRAGPFEVRLAHDPASIAHLYLASGADGFIAYLVDVTAQKQMELQLAQSEKMRAIGQFVGGVAHDFNNLLMAVMGNLHLLAKHVAGDARAQHFIEVALQGAERGAALTQRMLAFARRQELKVVPTDLGALVNGMRDFLVRSLGPSIVLTMETPPGLPAAEIDANQVELAILNLAINARDAMPDGGAIAITAAEREHASGRFIELSISDTGEGMDSETLMRAIDPFFSTKAPGKGTGLGLSMVHGLARQLGGWLELESEVGRGTQAALWLPVAAQEPVAAAPAAADVAPGRSATILVVDDDVLIGTSTVDMLQDLGHTVLSADSGAEALEILETEAAVELLLTDHAMPGMTGVELARIVRLRRPELPILLTSGYTDLPAGQSPDLPRLAKPYHQAELQAEIVKLLGVLPAPAVAR
jgi:signal transduction histidine kinase